MLLEKVFDLNLMAQSQIDAGALQVLFMERRDEALLGQGEELSVVDDHDAVGESF